VSVGIALSPEHSADAATLMRQADIAMYLAKRGQRGHAVYEPEQDHHSPERLALMPALRQALEEDRLLPCYQPMIDCQTGRLVGVEALVHWQHADHGFVPPDRFIPIAEHTGLIAPLTRWVLHHALHQAVRWNRLGLELNVAVNLSMRLLQDTALADSITALLDHYGIKPGNLTLEITESALMADPARTHEVLTRLADMGVHIAIDDFGTGQSSLGYLKQLPVDTLKIDKSFVLGMSTNAKDTALVRSIIAMSHALGLAVVAEGVENAETWELLRSLECDLAQGFYLGRPLPAEELEAWIEDCRMSRIA
jgi:EAL domain-containing protein (putative c-di-GMP-specific phosphodiesterase class I)